MKNDRQESQLFTQKKWWRSPLEAPKRITERMTESTYEVFYLQNTEPEDKLVYPP